MDKRTERTRESAAGQSGKRAYEPPEILSQEIFETTALACLKMPAQGGACTTSTRIS
jgi:hypothetical protein